MNKKLYSLFGLLVVASLVLAACGGGGASGAATVAPNTPFPTAVPAEEEAPAEPAALVCQVTDVGGIDDKSFNATAYKGVTDAVAALGVEGTFLESQEQADYETNINAFVEQGCDLIVTVGFLLGDATYAAADANPDQAFTIVDYGSNFDGNSRANLVGLNFATDQAAFLTGYIAAASTQTGTVATFGGINIPPVTAFMDGFWHGVQYYNAEHGTSVQVLGWNPSTPETGLFVGNFESTDDGRNMGETLLDEGADIIMPVAGPVGLGTAAAVQERGNAWIIGVDTDWTVSAAEYTNVILTSVLKNMDVAVYGQIEAVVNGTFAGGDYLGTLANGGVGYAGSFPDLEASLQAIAAGIADGSIQTSGAPQ
jgi:basic membrane protein A